MLSIIRKATGKQVAEVEEGHWLETVLACLPSGVYGVEDSEGNEVNQATVKAGRVSFSNATGS